MAKIKNDDKLVEVILAGSSSLSLRKSCFKENNIIDFRVPFSIGDLSNINDYVVKLPKCIYNEEIICDLNNDILKLDNLIDKDYKVRVWSSHYDVDSYLLLLFICNHLKNKVDNIIVLYSDEYKKEYYSPGLMTSEELEKLSTLEYVISKEEINILSEKWDVIKNENSNLRIIENKKVKSVDYDYLNDEIINMLNQKKFARIIDIVYELTKKYYISDNVFIFLITRLIDCGKIQIIEKNEKFIKSIIKESNKKLKYTWINDLVPNTIKVKQVYGIVFTDDFRILLRIEDNKYKLTGGKPEKSEDYEQTLKREYIEELNVELKDCYYLGYLLVEEDDESYAQVRMISKIKNINDKYIDLATGKIYGRKLVIPDRVKEYLNYQDVAGNIMLDEAIKAAKNKYVFDKINKNEELV